MDKVTKVLTEAIKWLGWLVVAIQEAMKLM